MGDCDLRNVRQVVPYYTEEDTGMRVFMRKHGDFTCANCGAGLYDAPTTDEQFIMAALDAHMHPDDFAGTPQHQEWEDRHGEG